LMVDVTMCHACHYKTIENSDLTTINGDLMV
jgi:hypothetical protein